MSRPGRPDAAEEIEVTGHDRRLVGRLWREVRPYRSTLVAATLLLPLGAGLDLLPPYLVKVAIDEHILRGDRAGLARVGMVLLAVLVAQYLFRYGQLYLLTWTGQHVVRDLRVTLFAHVQRLPASFFDRNPVGRLMTRMLGDVEAIGELFTSGIVAVAGDLVTLVGVVAVMLLLDWRLALVTFAVVPFLAGLLAFLRPRARAAHREVRNRVARLNGFLQESLQGMSVIQLFGREAAERDAFGALNDAHRRATFRRMRYDALLYAFVELIGSVAVAALLWRAGAGILAGATTFGVLVAFMEYTHRFFLPIRDVSAKYTVMQSAMVAAERIFTLLDVPPEPTAPRRAAGPRAAGAPALEFRDVWFRYQPGLGATVGEDGFVFRGLSFRIPRGQRVAVVGPTGAGKTTLARLLTRTYPVERGEVLVEGLDVMDWELPALRRHIGLVLQDVVVFSGSVEDNLTLASDVGRARAEEAARLAHVDAFIRTLPSGYDEELRERGANLSHGQRQLLSVARALVYNPPVLILDEATSSVDPETEGLLQDAIDHLLQGRTAILIAHRLSTIRRADRVIVLQHGAVIEDGSHGQLLARGGLYATMWELQQGGPTPAV